MVEYGGAVTHGGAGQVSGGGAVVNHAGSIDVGTSVSNFFNSAVTTFSGMPLAEQALLVGIAVILGFFILRKAF